MKTTENRGALSRLWNYCVMTSCELYSLFTSKPIMLAAAVLAVLCAVPAMLIGSHYGDFNYGFSDKAIRTLSDDLSGLSAEEQLSLLDERQYEIKVYQALETSGRLGDEFVFPILEEQRAQPYIQGFDENRSALYTDSYSGDLRLLESQLYYMNAVYGYNDYLEEIETSAKQMESSVLFRNPNTFARRNAAKTAAVYSHMPRQTLSYSITGGIAEVFDSGAISLCAVLLCVFAAMSLVTAERERGALSLIKPLKYGRAPAMLCKCAAMLAFCVLSVCVLYGVTIGICLLRFGLVDFSMPIQAVEGFQGCTLSVSLGGYLVIFLLCKGAALYAISAAVMLISVLSKNNAVIYTSVGVIAAIEIVLYTAFQSNSAAALLHEINILKLISTNDILYTLNYVNVGGYPFGLAPLSAILTGAIAVGCTAGAVAVHAKRHDDSFKSYRITDLTAHIQHGRKISVSPARHELHKMLFSGKGAFVIAAMAIVSVMLFQQITFMEDNSEVYYMRYATEHSGAVTQTTQEFVTSESERLSDLAQTAGDSISPLLTGFERFRESYEYAKENNVQIVYGSGYAQLISKANTYIQLMFLFAFMALFIAPVYSSDSEKMPLIRSTKYGRVQNAVTRLLLCEGISVVMLCLSHLPLLLRVGRKYGYDGLSAPVQSVPALREITLSVTTLEYLILRYSVLLVATLVAALVMLLFSRKIKSVSGCTAVLLAVFAGSCAVMLLAG